MFALAAYSLICLALAAMSAAQTQSFTPAAIPIAARSPYLLTFLKTAPSVQYSRTWQTGYSTQIQAWAGLIRVDGKTYAWTGDIGTMPAGILDPASTGNVQSLTPTTTVLFYQAGPVQLTVTFLSPIEPGNMVNQSIPASYVALDIQTTDGSPHSIQVYTDITAEWVSGDRSQNVTWSTNTNNPSMIYHTVSALNQVPYQEVKAQAAWGNVYYASLRTTNTTYRTGGDLATRSQFVTNGTLDNTQDTAFRGITDSFPVFAFAEDLGTIQRTSAPLAWAVANVRDVNSTGALKYTDLSQQTQTRSLYYRSQYTDDGSLLDSLLADFPAALNRSQALDKNITDAANAVGGSDYADILALATRQAYCGIEITIGRDNSGAVNASDVMAFYKDTGYQDNGDGNAQVSPVDGLISVFPAFLYLDPALCAALLEPLFRFQESPSYGNPYAAANLGLKYPAATASNDPHSEGIETSSGMIIMAYAHARATGDYDLINRYSTLLHKWADYLTSNTLGTSVQTSADGTTNSGQANLALKGIIAVQAMSKISALLKNSTGQAAYSSQAKSLYSQWSAQALTTDGHIRFTYEGTDSTFTLGYNIFWDLYLETGLLNATVVNDQTNYVGSQIQIFGMPTDSTNASVVSANWNMLMAAVSSRDNGTQQALISATHKLAASQPATGYLGQFPLMYTAQEGAVIQGRSSPRQGAMYAPLLVNASSILSSESNANGTASGNKNATSGTPVGAIVGGVVGGVAVLTLLVGLVFVWRRLRSSSRRRASVQPADSGMREAILNDASPVHHTPGVTPFMEVDLSRPPASSNTEGSSTSEYHTTPEADTKRAYRLRRIPNEELAQHTAMAHNSPASTAYPATSPSAVSNQSDPALGQGLLQEINSLWREISAMRTMDDGMSAPPEYDA
ncbi:unnamed protein product [Peniophora sp. CBMAI 1063]|nr:unnamed protein product [Peniophora sp. CBMAI 1063]